MVRRSGYYYVVLLVERTKEGGVLGETNSAIKTRLGLFGVEYCPGAWAEGQVAVVFCRVLCTAYFARRILGLFVVLGTALLDAYAGVPVGPSPTDAHGDPRGTHQHPSTMSLCRNAHRLHVFDACLACLHIPGPRPTTRQKGKPVPILLVDRCQQARQSGGANIARILPRRPLSHSLVFFLLWAA